MPKDHEPSPQRGRLVRFLLDNKGYWVLPMLLVFLLVLLLVLLPPPALLLALARSRDLVHLERFETCDCVDSIGGLPTKEGETNSFRREIEDREPVLFDGLYPFLGFDRQ